jgi:hypothetical protein
MNIRISAQRGWSLLSSILAAAVLSTSALANPSFESPDWRLPNPDRPFEMTSGTVTYDAFGFAIHDLKFQVANAAQLDTTSINFELNRWEFDSTFDVTFTAQVSRGLGPPVPMLGGGNARAIGFTRPVDDSPNGFTHPQVFDMELVSFNLFEHTTRPEIGMMLRESPTLQSRGVTIREDPCPMCAAPFTHWIISSFFDIYTEVSFNGGASWNPASGAIHVEQAPDGFPPGDYNKDYLVDSGDYIFWRKTLGQVGAGLAADGDWSGKVDAGDHDVWLADFGRVAVSSNARASNTTVPEPACLLPILVAALAAWASKRR